MIRFQTQLIGICSATVLASFLIVGRPSEAMFIQAQKMSPSTSVVVEEDSTLEQSGATSPKVCSDAKAESSGQKSSLQNGNRQKKWGNAQDPGLDLPQNVEFVAREELRDFDRPYRERKGSLGAGIGFQTENGKFSDLRSPIDGQTYDQLFAKSVQTFELNLSIQKKWKLFSLAPIVGFGGGSVQDGKSGISTKLEATKKFIGVQLLVDGIWDEPYFVPNLVFGMNSWDVTISNQDVKISSSNPFLPLYRLGGLFQINWIEPKVARKTYSEIGMENTFLEVYFSTYSASIKEGTPNLKFASTWGAGLSIQF